jgi:DNA-binding FrmR family transcriptional regulator
MSQSPDRLLGRGFIDSFVALLDCPGAGGTVAAVAAITGLKIIPARRGNLYIPLGVYLQVPPGVLGNPKMPEPIEDRQKLINRVRRLAGQIEALERAVENDAGFTEVMRLLTAGRGAINSIMAEVVEDHIQAHMLGRDRKPSRAEIEAAEELLDVLRSYIK